MLHYSMRVAWSNEDKMFVAVCPELGDLSALGDTRDEAIKELEVALELAMETYEEKEWNLPDPKLVSEYSGQFRIRLPKSLHAWLASEAQHEGVSLNSFVIATLSDAKGGKSAFREVAHNLVQNLIHSTCETVAKIQDTHYNSGASEDLLELGLPDRESATDQLLCH